MSRRLTADQTNWILLNKEGLNGDDALREIVSGRYVILIDERVRQLHLEWLNRVTETIPLCLAVLDIPSGESSKSVMHWSELTDNLFALGLRRNDALIAVGGGVVGDLVGFVASTLFRGVRLIHIPTTLLAMVDSSIGGKVGINHESGKNRIGAFYPAEWILVDPKFLKTLTKREWINGFAEMIKYGYIRNPKMLQELVSFPDELGLDTIGQHEVPAWNKSKWTEVMDRLQFWITESWKIKHEIVIGDEYEQGERMFLNYGHTFGHALEQYAGYGKIDHGVAVLAGMVCAGIFRNALEKENSKHTIPLEPLDPFLNLTEENWQDFAQQEEMIHALVNEMSGDKKNQSDRIRLILLQQVGRPFLHETIDRKKLEEVWKEAFEWISKQSERERIRK